MAKKGIKFSEEHKQKISIALTGRHLSDETKRKLREINKGKKYPEKFKRKMSEITKGKTKEEMGHNPFTCQCAVCRAKRGETKGEKSYMWGKHLAEEHRKKLSEALKGEKSSFWKGGIYPVNLLIRSGLDYAIWRKAVFERDDYTCQDCEARNGNGKTVYLQAHHIKSFSKYPELRFDVENGQTLCKECHKQLNGRRLI